MVLQLHVWGPAFGLSSIDAECLAAIAYLAQTTSPADYRLIQSSPSAVPTQHLPALHNPSTSTWTSGFLCIIAHLQTHPPPTFHDWSLPPPSSSLPGTATAPTPSAAADAAAYTSFLTAHAAPLLSLSLYVSSANYAAATRPAYSAVLPFPLPWTEPPALRAHMARRAEHLGVGGLDVDAGADAVADRERERAVEGGWISVPESLVMRKKKTVAGLLSAEQKARIKLEAAARDVLDVLGEVEWDGQMAAARCLAFGYLALMVVPDVPRPWLREVMEERYGRLCEFVRRFRTEVFPERAALPWAEDRDGSSAAAVGARFVRGALCEVPFVGEQWSRWWTARKKRQELERKGVKPRSSGDLLLLLGAGLSLTAVGVGAFFYRRLPPFGEAVQVWRKPLVTLSSFGAAGAMFSGALYGPD